MTASLPRILRTFLGANYALMLEYRAEIFLWVLAGISPFLMMGVWSQVMAAKPHATMNQDQIIAYFTATFIVRQFTIVWVIWEFEWRVVEGRLSANLLKPIDPVWEFVSAHIAEQFTRLPFWAALVLLAWFLYPSALHNDHPLTLLLVPPAILLVFSLRFIMQYCFAMLCFWIERASAVEQISWLPYTFLSGYLIPWNQYPPTLRYILEFTPFPYFVAFPVQFITGKLEIDITKGFAVMLAWIVALFILNRAMWHRGLKHYSGMGA